MVSLKVTAALESTAASLLPLIVIVMTCDVPSAAVTVNVSVSVCPLLSACTAALLLSSA